MKPDNSSDGDPHSGFTRVELLVSISIIIVLAALFFDVTGRVRAGVQPANPVAAMRQIGIAHVAYAAENIEAMNIMRDSGEVGSGHEGGDDAWVSHTLWGRAQPHLFAGIETKHQKTLVAEIKGSLKALFNTTDLRTMAGTPFIGVSFCDDLSGISVPLDFNRTLRPPWGAAPRRVSHYKDGSRLLYRTYGRYFVGPAQGTYSPLPVPGETRRGDFLSVESQDHRLLPRQPCRGDQLTHPRALFQVVQPLFGVNRSSAAEEPALPRIS